MATKFYPILNQVDGIKATFELPEAYIEGSLILAYNGQIYDTGVNIISQSPNTEPPTATLSFSPAVDTHTLMLIYTPKNEVSSGVRAYVHPPGGLMNEC